jgi:hypothetical protein
VGDIASTFNGSNLTNSQNGLFVCISTINGNGLVEWRRMDNIAAATQTIRDAHVIVVAQEGVGWTPTTGVPPTDALLNLPQVAGIAADFVDIGDGAELANALVAAAALSGSSPSTPCDVRLRPCNINLNNGAVLGPLSVPQATRLVGSADNQSAINGRNGAGEDQRILTLNLGAQVEKVQFISQAPTGAPIGAGGLLETLSSGCDIIDCVFNMQVNTGVNDPARTTLACIDTTTVSVSGGERLSIDRCRFFVGIGGSHRSLFGTDSVGIRTRGTQNLSVPGTIIRGSVFQILDVGIEMTTQGVNPCGDVCASQLAMDRIFRAGLSLTADAAQGAGYRFSDIRVHFDSAGAGAVPQTFIEITTLNNLGAISQVSVSGSTEHFSSGSAITDRNFARLNGQVGSNGITGVKFFGCGIEELTTTTTATDAIVLSDSVRGGDILCDWNNVPAVPTNVIVVLAGTPTWEHAHSV